MENSRRRFLRQAAMVTGGLVASPLLRHEVSGSEAIADTGAALQAPNANAANALATGEFPRRVLGRTKEKVSLIGIGTAPLGSGNTSAADMERVINAALDAGINYVDTSPDYGNAEAKLSGVMKNRREGLFLVTKVNPQRQDREGVQRQLEESLKRLGTDHVDAAHIHNLGDFDMERITGPDGALAGLKEARKRGLIRYIGASGHMRPPRFVKLIQTGDIDLVMVTLNFADRNNYDFEGLVLPAAQAQGTAVVAMKVLGGAVGWRYDGKTQGTLIEHYEQAMRYSLGLPGVTCAVLGVSNENEVHQAVTTARAYKPLSDVEKTTLLEAGRKLATARGLYYGPIDG